MRTLFLSAVLALLLSACVSPGEYWRRATTPIEGGDAPAATIAKKAPRLVGNPDDVDAWLEVAKALGYIIVGAGGKAGVDKLRKKPI